MVKKLMDKFYTKSIKISKKVLKMFSKCYIIILETIPKKISKNNLGLIGKGNIFLKCFGIVSEDENVKFIAFKLIKVMRGIL